MVGAGALDQRDGAGEDGAVAGLDAGHIVVDPEVGTLRPRHRGTKGSLRPPAATTRAGQALGSGVSRR